MLTIPFVTIRTNRANPYAVHLLYKINYEEFNQELQHYFFEPCDAALHVFSIFKQ